MHFYMYKERELWNRDRVLFAKVTLSPVKELLARGKAKPLCSAFALSLVNTEA